MTGDKFSISLLFWSFRIGGFFSGLTGVKLGKVKTKPGSHPFFRFLYPCITDFHCPSLSVTTPFEPSEGSQWNTGRSPGDVGVRPHLPEGQPTTAPPSTQGSRESPIPSVGLRLSGTSTSLFFTRLVVVRTLVFDVSRDDGSLTVPLSPSLRRRGPVRL